MIFGFVGGGYHLLAKAATGPLFAKAVTGRRKIGGDGGDAKGRNRGLATSGEKSRGRERVGP
jgi:hypothetical protein